LLTPAGLRSAIAHAVMEIAPEKAKKRREEAAKDARVERWAEDSGNAALAGRELPPAQVLAETRTAGRSTGHDGRQVTFTAASQPGPPGGYGTWWLATGPACATGTRSADVITG
jgi:hypothetical protein